MGHEVMSDDPDELIRIAVRLWGRIREAKEKVAMLETELAKVEDKIASKMSQNRSASA